MQSIASIPSTAEDHMQLVIANKAYSSWSLRPWLALTVAGIPFEELVIPLRQADTASRILAHSPSGKVPCLIDGGTVVWESLAILEHLAERFPDQQLWPADRAARAHARAIAAEMHAGFMALRQACPMDVTRRFAPRERGPEVAADAARIGAIWREARQRFGAGGPFLYGAFSAADAMYAPVATRFWSYGIPLDAVAQAYVDAILALPAFKSWQASALAEPWVIAEYARGDRLLWDGRAGRV
jgi:glutathione S-transferase